jgi:ribosome biogenesis protein MAK21
MACYLEEVPPVTCSQNADLVAEKYAIAESLWKADAERYEKRKTSCMENSLMIFYFIGRLQKSKASRDFINTVLKNGTVTDKVSALTLLVQESPVHNLNYFSQYLLQGMAKKKSRREAILAVDSIKDLLLNNLLPDRKLK